MRDTSRYPRRSTVGELIVSTHATITARRSDVREGLVARMHVRVERGDVAPRTVAIAVMAGNALTVGGIIATNLEATANALDLGE
jgi:hypothetical protein